MISLVNINQKHVKNLQHKKIECKNQSKAPFLNRKRRRPDESQGNAKKKKKIDEKMNMADLEKLFIGKIKDELIALRKKWYPIFKPSSSNWTLDHESDMSQDFIYLTKVRLLFFVVFFFFPCFFF
jgi:hypothetical protein